MRNFVRRRNEEITVGIKLHYICNIAEIDKFIEIQEFHLNCSLKSRAVPQEQLAKSSYSLQEYFVILTQVGESNQPHPIPAMFKGWPF